jgi:hypothetical protein
VNSPQTIEFSLTQGGPLYRLLRKLGIIRLDDNDALRQSLAVIFVAWLPLELLALLDLRWNGPPQFFSFWTVVSVHVRFLIAIPMLFVAARVLERCCRSAIVCFSEGGFVRGSYDQVAALVRDAERSRNSSMAEFLMLMVVALVPVANVILTGRFALLHDFHDDQPKLAFGAVWYGLFSLPLFNFLLLRAIRHWWIWTNLLWRLARLQLHLIPTHPDRAGGIGHLADPTYGIALVLAATSSVTAASWGSYVYFGKTDPASFIVQLVALILLGLVVAIGPLVPFARALVQARLEGSDPYSGFAATYTRLFERRWVESRDQTGLLGTQDISGLADLISSYQSLETLRLLPFGRDQLIAVVLAVLIPMLPLPVLASGLPVGELLARLFKGLVLGG